MDELRVEVRDDIVYVEVQVVPRASRSAVAGSHGGRLKVQLNAPPVDGAANQALIALLSKVLRVPKRQVTIVRGERSRQKTVAIAGSSPQAVQALVP